MPEFVVNIRSRDHIEAHITDLGEGRLQVNRSPKVGIPTGMGYGGAEILCFAAATCLYNNIQ